ncbi:hypothetical protein RHGRI_029444 [Rhododendron griersonianum]|uniref:Uncharacterized protein n=1 Tax=Rhododendron griersonianum TaxID=479676 RepID=A0AAV6IJD3_9ERIC|nr:hypothetical protein RHGRI_029444 [Rhododendron griersonianum]
MLDASIFTRVNIVPMPDTVTASWIFTFNHTDNKFKFLSFLWDPLSWVMEAATAMAIVVGTGGMSLSNPGFGL